MTLSRNGNGVGEELMLCRVTEIFILIIVTTIHSMQVFNASCCNILDDVILYLAYCDDFLFRGHFFS